MKLVTEYLTAGEASLAASSLESAGITTYISNSDSARRPIATRNAGGVGLWVVVDKRHWLIVCLLQQSSLEGRMDLRMDLLSKQ